MDPRTDVFACIHLECLKIIIFFVLKANLIQYFF